MRLHAPMPFVGLKLNVSIGLGLSGDELQDSTYAFYEFIHRAYATCVCVSTFVVYKPLGINIHCIKCMRIYIKMKWRNNIQCSTARRFVHLQSISIWKKISLYFRILLDDDDDDSGSVAEATAQMITSFSFTFRSRVSVFVAFHSLTGAFYPVCNALRASVWNTKLVDISLSLCNTFFSILFALSLHRATNADSMERKICFSFLALAFE